MRIAIIGAGVAGLSSYLFLDKHLLSSESSDHSINIYESHDISATEIQSRGTNGEPVFMPKAIGAALGIGKNGLKVLQRIDENGAILRRIQSKGHTISKWKMRSARGWTIIETAVTSSNEKRPTDQQSAADMLLIARYSVWKTLCDEVLRRNPEAVINKKLVKLESLADGQVQLHFEDGSLDTADLVIGADGLRSLVRQTIFQHNNDVESQTWFEWMLRSPPKPKDYITPQFEYLVGLGGFVPSEVLEQSGVEKGSITFTLGANGFFGHGFAGERPHNEGQGDDTKGNQDIAVWWSTFSSSDPNTFRTKEVKKNLEPSNDYKTDFDREAALSSLLTHHQAWRDPAVKDILRHVGETRALEHTYPTYTTPELPTWQMNGNMVLIGDAAHALQPSSGQGTSQAFEDAESLALFLKHYLESARIESITKPELRVPQQHRATARALNEFVLFRKPRVAQIYKQSQQAARKKGDMNTLQEFLMYFFIWLLSKLQIMQKYNEELFEYDLPAEVAVAIYRNSELCTLNDTK